MSSSESNRAIYAALGSNVGIAVIKLVAALITGSTSMLAEAIHSGADTGNQLLLLRGRRKADRAASAEHPFGHGRQRYLYAFVVALILFSLGGLAALYEGWHKVQHPEPLDDAWVAIVVLLAGIGLEGFSLRTAMHEVGEARGEMSWWRFIRTTKAPELPVVLLEDSAAITGLLLALLGIVIALLTGDPVWDGVGSMCIGALLVVVALVLGRETSSLLVGESASREDVERIRAALVTPPEVDRVIHMRTLHLGPEELLVAAKIAVGATDSAATVARAIDAAEVAVRAAVPIASVIYLEPDIDRGPDAGVQAPGGASAIELGE